MEGVAEGVGVSLVVGRHVRVLLLIFDCVGGVLLVEVECGCGWKALRRVLSRASLVVLDRRMGWEVLCWETAWRISGGV